MPDDKPRVKLADGRPIPDEEVRYIADPFARHSGEYQRESRALLEQLRSSAQRKRAERDGAA